MDDVDAGPSWAQWRARRPSWDQEPERQQTPHHTKQATLHQSQRNLSSNDLPNQSSNLSTKSLSTTSSESTDAYHASNTTDSSGSTGAYRNTLYFSMTQNRPILQEARLSSSASPQLDFLTQDDLDIVTMPANIPQVPQPEEEEDPSIVCIHPAELALLLKAGLEKYLLIDSRSFLEFNTSHIQQSTNVCCSRLVKRRLQRDKVLIRDLLTQTCHIDVEEFQYVIVYDQMTEDPNLLSDDTFLSVLLQKLATTFSQVSLLKGGFLAFQAMYPSLCESKTSTYRCAALTSLSQPCLPVSNVGPTRILPFLYLGSQQDALSQDIVQVNEITYVLNVSTTCIKPPFIPDGHFLRIPVNDNYSAKLTPYFNEAFQFLDKVREANGCCLVHCLAGISRSPTLAIAYIMKHLNMSSDDAYRYVKDKRPTISPNFNFLGQLLEFEKKLKQDQELNNKSGGGTAGQRQDGRHWSNYVMDLSSHSPSSPAAKTGKPFVFDTSQSQLPAAQLKPSDKKKANQCDAAQEKSEIVSDCDVPKTDQEAFRQPLPGPSKTVKTEPALYSQRAPFPCSKESKVRPNVLNLGCDSSRRVPTMFATDSNNSISKSLTDITEISETESPSPSVIAKAREHLFTTSSVVTKSRPVEPLLSPFPCGESTIQPQMSPFPCGQTTVHTFIMDQCKGASSTSVSGIFHSKIGTKDTDTIDHNQDQFEVSASKSSLSKSKFSHVTLPSTSKHFSLSLSTSSSQTSARRLHRSSLSLSLTPVTPSRSPVLSGPDSGNNTSTVFTDKHSPSTQKMDTSLGSDIPSSSNIPSFPSPQPVSSSTPFSATGSVTMSHVVKLKSFLLSSPSLSMLAQSPTSSLAKLHFNTDSSSDSDNVLMSSSRSGSNSPSQEHQKHKHKVCTETLDGLSFYSFPSTSLDKLNFTPCLSNSSESIQSSSTGRTSGLKRPLNTDTKESDLESVGSLNSSIASSSNNSSVSSPTSVSNPPKVVVRKREGRAKRTLVRPNSIAFSSYPTFDLGSEGQDSPNSGSSTTSQDDSSESFIQNGKKSKSSDYMTDVRFRLGRYSEREMYRQITAVMETAMLKTQVYEASRKSRSLDDILSSEDDSSAPNCESSMFDRVLRHCGLNRDRYTSPSLLEQHACSGSHGPADHYHSNSSLSSTGSHTSLHNSVELIQVS